MKLSIKNVFNSKNDRNQESFAKIASVLTNQQTALDIESFINNFEVNREDEVKLQNVKVALKYPCSLKVLYLYSDDSTKFTESKNEVLSVLSEFFEKFIIHSDDCPRTYGS